MLAWMEQCRHRASLRIAADEIGSFVEIAPEAGEGEIFERVISFVLTGYDMFNLQRDNRLVIAMEVTIFTPVAGALDYESSTRGVHQDAL
jgi:hypothetical protein